MLTVNPKKRIEWNELLNYFEKKERTEPLQNITNFGTREKSASNFDIQEHEYKNLIKERNKVLN